MPGEDIQSWSTTAATNATADTSINWAEGQPRASVNNSARSMMAAHAKKRNLENGSITTTGSANAQAVASGIPYTTVPTGLYVRLKIGFTNTGPTTLDMDSIGAVAIKNADGSDIIAYSLTLGRYAEFIYNGTNWILLTPTVYGAAIDALAYNGMQVNGACEVDQALAGNVTAAGSQYIADNWQKNSTGAVGLLASPSSVSPAPPAGFQKFVRLCTTANVIGSLAAGDSGYLLTSIEGYRVARLGWGTANAQPISIGFWVHSNIVGTMTVAVLNAGTTRSYRTDVVINTALTWEYKTVSVPGDLAGTWQATNAVGLHIIFCFGGGSSFQGAAGTWTASGAFATAATTNFYSIGSNQQCVTGVVVVPGLQLPSASMSPLIMRPLDQELVLCQRYYEKSYDYAVAPGTVSANGQWEMYTLAGIGNFQAPGAHFSVQKRAVPTVVSFSVANGQAGTAFAVTAAGNVTANISSIGETGFLIYFGAVAADLIRFQWIADARI